MQSAFGATACLQDNHVLQVCCCCRNLYWWLQNYNNVTICSTMFEEATHAQLGKAWATTVEHSVKESIRLLQTGFTAYVPVGTSMKQPAFLPLCCLAFGAARGGLARLSPDFGLTWGAALPSTVILSSHVGMPSSWTHSAKNAANMNEGCSLHAMFKVICPHL